MSWFINYIVYHIHIFVGEFGSERLVQKVVDTILRQTAKKIPFDPKNIPKSSESELQESKSDSPKKINQNESSPKSSNESSPRNKTKPASTVDENFWKSDTASKIILTGFKVNTLIKK